MKNLKNGGELTDRKIKDQKLFCSLPKIYQSEMFSDKKIITSGYFKK